VAFRVKILHNKFQALVARMQTGHAKKAAGAPSNATPEQLAEAYRIGITPRTSITSPLRIYAINLEFGNAAIGMTICPGKRGESDYGGPWRRDLIVDMEVIREWDCRILVTVMELGELEAFHVTNLGASATSAGIQWYHIPITDGDPPDERFETLWPEVGPVILNALRGGQRVVIHCRGGLGRTGMIACLLLIELGWSPQSSLETVRQKRPGTVETPAQELYVLNYQPHLSPHE